jgi:hypothetical protein
MIYFSATHLLLAPSDMFQEKLAWVEQPEAQLVRHHGAVTAAAHSFVASLQELQSSIISSGPFYASSMEADPALQLAYTQGWGTSPSSAVQLACKQAGVHVAGH